MKQLKKLYQIEEFFPAAGDSRFKIDVTVDEDTLHVVTPDQFKDSALYDYGERSFLCFENDIPLTAFYNRFSAWFSQREYVITKEEDYKASGDTKAKAFYIDFKGYDIGPYFQIFLDTYQ